MKLSFAAMLACLGGLAAQGPAPDARWFVVARASLC